MVKRAIQLFLGKNLFLLFCVVFFVIYYLSAFRLPNEAIVFPKLVLFILVPVVIWNLIGSFIDIKAQLAKEVILPSQVDQQTSTSSHSIKWDHFFVVVATFIYIFCIPILGFFVATTIYTIGVLYFFGISKPVNIFFYVIGMDVFIYLTFVLWVKIDFPKGIFI